MPDCVPNNTVEERRGFVGVITLMTQQYSSYFIQHLPGNTLAEEIYKGLVELGFDIISMKQMSTTRRSQGSSSTSLPMFLITLSR
jgi:hypothetical protein